VHDGTVLTANLDKLITGDTSRSMRSLLQEIKIFITSSSMDGNPASTVSECRICSRRTLREVWGEEASQLPSLFEELAGGVSKLRVRANPTKKPRDLIPLP
jgi:hypothetical protein